MKQTTTPAKAASNTTDSIKKRGLGVVKKNDKGTVYVQFNKNVEITIGGEKVDLGKYRTIFFEPVDKVLAYVEKRESEGTISEKAAEVTRSICNGANVRYIIEGKLA